MRKIVLLPFLIGSHIFGLNLDQAYYELALALQNQGVLSDASTYYRKTLHHNSNHQDALYNLAMICLQQNNTQMYIELITHLLKINPNHHQAARHMADYYFKKAINLTERGDITQALKIYNDLMMQNPHNPTLLHNTAYVLKKNGEFDKSIDLYRKALKYNPDNKKAHFGLAYAYLAQNKYQEAFEQFVLSNEFSLDSHQMVTDITQVRGKRILVTAHWVLEDTLLCARYVKILHDFGATIILQSPHELQSLFEQCHYIDTVITKQSSRIPNFDMYVPLLNIPDLYTKINKSIPSFSAYICASQRISAQWQQKLSHDTNIKIGIAWHNKHNNEHTAIPISLFEPLSHMPMVSLYALQNIRENDLHTLPHEMMITSFGKSFDTTSNDINTLAAIMKNLDIIISNDSFIAHLASSLGCKTIVVTHHNASWYWNEENNISLWYPNTKVFKQTVTDYWTDITEAITHEISLHNK